MSGARVAVRLCAAITATVKNCDAESETAEACKHLREHPHMTSAKFSNFVTLSPWQHLELIFTLKFTQLPYYVCFSITLPSDADIISG